MKVLIKNMLCTRCRLFVKAQLAACGLPHNDVEIGHACIYDPVSEEQLKRLDAALREGGLELTHDHHCLLIDKIKRVVLDLVHDCTEPLTLKFSEYLSRKLKYDYAYLSHLFATHEGMTLEHYLISERIRKVKELVEQGLTLTEISYRMCYCSVQHLSMQFKKVTGITPSEFRKRTVLQ